MCRNSHPICATASVACPVDRMCNFELFSLLINVMSLWLFVREGSGRVSSAAAAAALARGDACCSGAAPARPCIMPASVFLLIGRHPKKCLCKTELV